MTQWFEFWLVTVGRDPSVRRVSLMQSRVLEKEYTDKTIASLISEGYVSLARPLARIISLVSVIKRVKTRRLN